VRFWYFVLLVCSIGLVVAGLLLREPEPPYDACVLALEVECSWPSPIPDLMIRAGGVSAALLVLGGVFVRARHRFRRATTR
jgi:hypothetical protein